MQSVHNDGCANELCGVNQRTLSLMSVELFNGSFPSPEREREFGYKSSVDGESVAEK